MNGGLRARVAATLGSFSLDVEIAIGDGRTLVLLGPNGSGKSTFLECVAGLRAPGNGRVVLGTRVLHDTDAGVDLPPEERRVGLVFQDFALFPHATVRGNVAYGPRARGIPRAERARLPEDWMRRLHIEALAERAVTSLSGGERQRVALARALAAGAEILLLDEPFASLDASLRARVRAELRAFLKEVGLPALVVTHDPLDALVLGDRLAVIENGRLVQTGTAEEVLAHPATPFVADLVGLNVYEATVASGVGLKEARTGDLVFHVLADGLAGPAHIAFAPSDVALAATPQGGSFQNAFPLRVRDCLPLGDRLRVVLEAGMPMAADITRESARHLPLEPGSTLWAMVKATSIRVFP